MKTRELNEWNKIMKVLSLSKSMVETQQTIKFWEDLSEESDSASDIEFANEITVILQDILEDYRSELKGMINNGTELERLNGR